LLPESSPDPARATEALSILVVEPAIEELLALVATLSAAGFRVTAADSFAHAKPLLTAHPPAILLTALRPGVHNGLHLLLRGKAARPDMAALVTSPVADPVLQADAEAMGATFIVKPVTDRDLIAAVLRTVYQRDPESRPIRPPFERRVADRRTSEQPYSPERRVGERRRDLATLVRGGLG